MKIFVLGLSLVFCLYTSAQNCAVEKESLKGKYTGDCKKGKANGKGQAAGTDSYDGEFKSGLPDGEGTYTWKNGTVYQGHFSKGLKQGEGTITYKREGKSDSTVKGFWEKDQYIGLYEQPYTVFTKDKFVDNLDVKFQKQGINQITFFVSDAAGGGYTAGGTQRASAKVDNVQLVSGQYGLLSVNDTHAKQTETVLNEVSYPIRMKVYIAGEELEMEFREPGAYTVRVTLSR